MAVEYTWHQVALFLGSLGIGLPKSLYGPKSGPYSSYEKLCFELSVTVYQQRMAESTGKQRDSEPKQHEEADEEDYMGDLSQFLPPETTNPSKSSAKKSVNKETPTFQSFNKKSKNISWQEQRRLEREKKQQEEDEQTMARIEAPIPPSNIGFKLLKQMGYTPGSALGKEGSGRAEPVGIQIRRTRVGIGREEPHKEKRKREEIEAERNRMKERDLMEEFGSRQKSQWRSRRVVVNFMKAKAALDQLENKEVVEPKKNEDEEDGEQDEEEEEEITEEDLQELLMKLRDEYQYCPFCGFQYETVEALLSNCPGINEDDH
ncbi:G patch domain-containing protein 11 [Populus alba x Populus x berolinensis]|uniref:G patch domain-containing protein 11 n=4 Tax=Populus TaxID=3689 RepID=A0A4U5NMI6_POPAL|nr:G patch domain-containing protein 11 [Populus alba x Populus x berolinensis]TKR84144.1 G patch domain-containing protein 11 [Populus alba]